MALSKEQIALYSNILNSQVLSNDVHELLKKYKDDNREKIKLTASKAELIENLLDVVDQGIVSIVEVQTLIKDSEEYGDQHIYLYEANSSSKSYYNDGATLRDIITTAADRAKFPRFISDPGGLEWSDFRIAYRGIPNSWMLKLYDRKIREVKEDDRFDASLGKRYVTFRREEFRLIYILTWDGVSELEMKLTRTSFDSNKGIKSSIATIKNAVHSGGRGIVIDRDFKEIDLRGNISNIILHSAANAEVYKLVNAVFVDSENGVSTIKSGDDLGTTDLLSEESRKEAVDAFMNGAGYAKSVTIRLLAAGSNGVLSNDMNIVLGRDDINHIVIPAKIKPQDYRYVRRKIAEFN